MVKHKEGEKEGEWWAKVRARGPRRAWRWWGTSWGVQGMRSPAGSLILGGSPQGGGRLEGLPLALPLSLQPAFRGRGVGGPHGRVSDAWTTSPGPYHLDGRAMTAAGAGLPRLLTARGPALGLRAACGACTREAPRSDHEAGGAGRGWQSPLLWAGSACEPAEKVIPLLFPGYFDGVR